MRHSPVSRFDCPEFYYRKSPIFWEAQNVWCNHPKIHTKRLYHRVMHPKDADSIANSEDPDPTAPQSALGLHYLPRPICLDGHADLPL